MLNLTTDTTILENFAAAITRQAAIDYIDAYRYLIHHRNEPTSEDGKKKWRTAKRHKRECEQFFNSDCFSVLCPTIRPEWFINELRKQARYGKKERRETV